MELKARVRKPRELKDWAYEVIKSAILDLEIQPGSQLSVQDLTEQLDVSRTPVREALLRLENDGLVRAVPRVGFFVTEVSKRDLKELFELRELLEGYAAQEAAYQLREEELAEVIRLYERSTALAEEGNPQGFLEFEARFHELIIQRCGNQRLIAVMDSLNDLTYRERILSLKVADNVELSCGEHKKVVEALRERDGLSAGKYMREHLSNIRERLLVGLELPE